MCNERVTHFRPFRDWLIGSDIADELLRRRFAPEGTSGRQYRRRGLIGPSDASGEAERP
jgi:hypothetical protein